MSTRAIQFLKQQAVAFDVIRYPHEEKGAEFAASAIGFPIERTVKTLVVDLGPKKYGLVLMPGHRQLSLKKLAKTCAVKRTAMVDTTTAERLTGYLVGGISPFGTKQRLPAILDKSLTGFEQVVINGGQRGVMLKLAPEDIVKVLGCKVAAIAHK